jgi:hypothetical protein
MVFFLERKTKDKVSLILVLIVFFYSTEGSVLFLVLRTSGLSFLLVALSYAEELKPAVLQGLRIS